MPGLGPFWIKGIESWSNSTGTQDVTVTSADLRLRFD